MKGRGKGTKEKRGKEGNREGKKRERKGSKRNRRDSRRKKLTCVDSFR